MGNRSNIPDSAFRRPSLNYFISWMRLGAPAWVARAAGGILLQCQSPLFALRVHRSFHKPSHPISGSQACNCGGKEGN